MGSLQSLLGSVAKATVGQLPGVEGVYRLFIDSKLNPATGVQTTRYHDIPLHNLSMNSAAIREMSPGGAGPVQTGDSELILPTADLASGFPYAKSKDVSTSDLLVVAGITYRVVVPQYVANGVMLRLIVRRVSK